MIANPSNSVIYKRPPLVKYQIDAVFHDERYGEIEASTKSGKTHACLAWLFEQAILNGRPGRNFWWVAPTYSQAEIAYRRLKVAIPQDFRKTNDSELKLTLPNGAYLWCKTGEKPDNLYGEDVYAAVIDEASRLREEAWHAIRSTLTKTEGPIRMIGNVKGRHGWFYKLCRKAESGEPGHKYSKIIAADAIAAGVLSQEEVDDAQKTLPENVFKELFLAEASDDGGNPFGIAHIARCVGPLSRMAPVAFGVDLAKSVDHTVVIGLDMLGQVCHFERFQMPWKETIARIKNIVGPIKALVDSTGVGDPVLEELQRIDEAYHDFEGYKFSMTSKQQLMEGLAVGIQQSKIKFPEGAILTELESFEYEYSRTGVHYSAPEGQHDDCVCALALAWQLFASSGSMGMASGLSASGVYHKPAVGRPDWV